LEQALPREALQFTNFLVSAKEHIISNRIPGCLFQAELRRGYTGREEASDRYVADVESEPFAFRRGHGVYGPCLVCVFHAEQEKSNSWMEPSPPAPQR